MKATLNRALTRGGRSDDGFTLVEILVVIIIIGILAAIAIPIFLNQQRTARDVATISDVRNLATNVETALVSHPEATEYHIVANRGSTTGSISVGTPGDMSDPITFSKTEGTGLVITRHLPAEPDPGPGEYIIRGFNRGGQEYTGWHGSKYVAYDSANGGITVRAGTAPVGTP